MARRKVVNPKGTFLGNREPISFMAPTRIMPRKGFYFGQKDMVNHPPHYTTGRIEVIDFIEDKGFEYHEGNAIKYISRAKLKGNRIEDLEKAVWYLQRKIKLLTNENAISFAKEGDNVRKDK